MANSPQTQGNATILPPSLQGTPNVAALFAQARSFHQAGKLADAENCYRQVLEINGDDINAINNLGMLYLQQGKFEEGIRLLRRSVGINPEQCYAEMNLGNAYRELKCPSEALGFYDRAIALQPDFPQAYFNRGNAHYDLGRMSEALADYGRAITLKPDYFQACFNKGNVLKELHRLDEAVASYDQAISFNPDYAQAYYNRSFVLNKLNRLTESLADCDRIISYMPNFPEAHYNRGNALLALRQLTGALASFDRATVLNPRYADAYSNRGNVLKELGQLSEALASYERAISIHPDNAEYHYNRGNILLPLNRFAEAVESFEMALAIAPKLPYAFGALLHSRMHCCDWHELDSTFTKIVKANSGGEKVSVPFFFLAIPSGSDQQKRCAQIYAHDKYPVYVPPVWAGERYVHERIRVGYFSSDFRNHAMAYLIAEMIERHDRSRFEIIAFSFSPPTDSPIRQRLEKAFDRFIDVSAMSDQDIALLSRRTEIDIAIDLNGYTANSRAEIFAMRHAPIQVNHLGYPGTLGANFIDYIIADQTVIPEERMSDYSEQIVYLPNTYWFNDSTKEISDRRFSRAELGLPDDRFVFCCFNNSYKITPDVFDIWMRLLSSVEGSVLWLLEGNLIATDHLRREAEKRGVSPDRLVFAPRMALPDHLARHRQADLFLDTFYYNAHTTASDALWTGLPVLTCPGETFASRVAASMLNAIGLPDLIAQSPAGYEALAMELANNLPKLAGIKARLEKNRRTYPLFDTALFTQHIETAYSSMWERYQSGLPPLHIHVPA